VHKCRRDLWPIAAGLAGQTLRSSQLPVCAVPITSLPASTAGMQPTCTWVGLRMPSDCSTLHSQSLTPSSLKVVASTTGALVLAILVALSGSATSRGWEERKAAGGEIIHCILSLFGLLREQLHTAVRHGARRMLTQASAGSNVQ